MTGARYSSTMETEARDHGFNMNAVYDALNISATDTDKFSKAAQWKTANCGSVLSTSDHSIVDAEYKKLLSVPVALAAISAWKACITAPPSGLACSTISNNPSSVTFYARYIPNIAGVVPKVTSSSASNVKPAGGQPPHTQPIAIFKAGKVITPQGIYANFDILEPSEDVQFQLSADALSGIAQLQFPHRPFIRSTRTLPCTATYKQKRISILLTG
jgi:hypothetical protein